MSDPTPSSSSAAPDLGALSLSNGDAGAPAAAAPRKQARLAELPPMPPRSSRNKEESDGSADERDEEDGDENSDVDELEGARIKELGNGEETAEGEDVADLLKEYPDDEEYIDLTHLRLKTSSLRKLGLARFKQLKRLGLRQNEISKIAASDIGQLRSLTDLDLYDNGLSKTYGEVLEGCPELESLDFSFNSIRHISHLTHLAKLRTLYFVQNKISRVRTDDLTGPIGASLRSLELGGNRLRSIENIGHLTQLEELWLGKNKITKLQGLEKLKSLRVLSIQSNRITKLENLSELEALEELYISHNGLTKLEGLEGCKRLTTLDIGANRIEQIENVAHLSALEEFWANDNRISTLGSLEAQLGPKNCPNLATVYLEHNPVQRSEGTAYRRKIMLLLPQIQQIDAIALARVV